MQEYFHSCPSKFGTEILTDGPAEILIRILQYFRHGSLQSFFLKLTCKSIKSVMEDVLEFPRKLWAGKEYLHLSHLPILPSPAKYAISDMKMNRLFFSDISGFRELHYTYGGSINLDHIATLVQSWNLDGLKFVLDRFKCIPGGISERCMMDKIVVMCAVHGCLRILKFLKSIGCDMSANSSAALCRAAENGHVDIVDYLCRNGANLNIRGNKPFLLAVENNRLEVVRYICSNHRKTTVALNSSAVVLAFNNKYWDIFEFLCTTNNGYHIGNILTYMCMYGHVEIIKFLIREKMFDAHSTTAEHALRVAASRGKINVVEVLCEANVNIHTMNDYPLRWACRNGHLAVAILLVTRGANIHASGGQALNWANAYRRTSIVLYLQGILLQRGQT